MHSVPTAVAGVLLLLALPASAGKFVFERIADASTPGRGWTQPLSFGAPAMDQGRVAFNAYQVSHHGTYLAHQGVVDVVAETGTPIPGTADTYGSFGDGPDVSGDHVAFLAYDGMGYPIYTALLGGVLTLIADQNTPDPSGGGAIAIDYSVPPSIDGTRVVFRGFHAVGGGPAVFLSQAGTLSVLVDETSALPGGGPVGMQQDRRTALDGATMVFRGLQSPAWGLYAEEAGGLAVVANQDTVLPFAPSGIASLEGDASARNGTVAFDATSVDGRLGIYAATDGAIVRVIDGTQSVPGTSDSLDYLNHPDHGGPANDGQTVAFTGGNAFGPLGLFLYRNGVIHTVLDTDDTLDGGDVTNLQIGRDSVDGDRVAFTAWFADGTQAVYVASFAPAVPALPVPAAWLLAALLACAAGPALRLHRRARSH